MRSTAMLLLLLPVALAAGPGKGRQRLQPLAAEDKAAYTMLANENADAAAMLKQAEKANERNKKRVAAFEEKIKVGVVDAVNATYGGAAEGRSWLEPEGTFKTLEGEEASIQRACPTTWHRFSKARCAHACTGGHVAPALEHQKSQRALSLFCFVLMILGPPANKLCPPPPLLDCGGPDLCNALPLRRKQRQPPQGRRCRWLGRGRQLLAHHG